MEPHRQVFALLTLAVAVLASDGELLAGPYVTETSGVRWNDVGGVRWNDVGGVRWNDVGGVRWNDAGGVRWNDVGGLLFTEASGVRWNDVGGVRWNDVGSIVFDDATITGSVSVGLELLDLVSALPDSSAINVVVTYTNAPTQADLDRLVLLGIPGGTRFRRLPMVVVNATKQQIRAIAALPSVRSVWSNSTLSFFDDASADQIGLDEVALDPELRTSGGSVPTGAGVTVAVIDSGIDTTHPDLPLLTKVLDNVVLLTGPPSGIGFLPPAFAEGQANTDHVLGHGTFVASVAAGSGQASGGRYAGVAPGAALLGLAAGELLIVNVLEAFDYVLENRQRFGIRVVNCSWGTQGWFDPDDPVNVATRMLHDAGISVVFAAGNHGPAPDSLNPYSVAPWVIGVGAVNGEGGLSTFSSRGIFEELIYHPTLVAPGEGIVGARAGLIEHVGGVAGVADPTSGESVPAAYAVHYTVSSGTSFAAPHVAGIVARMLELDPALTPVEIKRRLQRTASPMLTHARSQVGAGILDAWAGLAATVDASRSFGTHYAGWLDARPFRIVHEPAVVASATVDAGSSVSVELALPVAALAWEIGVAWGDEQPLHDLDLRLLDEAGSERARSETINGAGLFGRVEGASVQGALPELLNAEVSFKEGLGVGSQVFHLRHAAASATLTGYQDLGELAAADLDAVAAAVSRGAMIGRGTSFAPHAALLRGELARALALVSGLPQRVPSTASFDDVPASWSLFPYVESVAGRLATSQLMAATTSGSRRSPVERLTGAGRSRAVLTHLAPATDRPWDTEAPPSTPSARSFKPCSPVERLDFAKALVRAAGLAALAESRQGASLGLGDEDRIAPGDRGYAAVALERGFLSPVVLDGVAAFDAKGQLDRLEACRRLLTLLDVRAGSRFAP